jgi:hypothetical protein
MVEDQKDLQSSPQASKVEEGPPQSLEIDFTPELYEQIKAEHFKKINRIVRPYFQDFIDWLKKLDPLDVYDALEKGETLKTFYDRQKLGPYRLGAAAVRGFLKASKSARSQASLAFDIKIARLVLRFENHKVYAILLKFDPEEKYLKGNIQDLKVILGLVKVEK